MLQYLKLAMENSIVTKEQSLLERFTVWYVPWNVLLLVTLVNGSTSSLVLHFSRGNIENNNNKCLNELQSVSLRSNSLLSFLFYFVGIYLFWDWLSLCSSSKPVTPCVSQAGLDLTELCLHLPPWVGRIKRVHHHTWPPWVLFSSSVFPSLSSF